MDQTLQFVFAAVAIAICVLVVLYKKPTQRLPLPPGPKPLPILKNILDMPSSHEWRTFDKWFKKYGTFKSLVYELLETCPQETSATSKDWESGSSCLVLRKRLQISFISEGLTIQTECRCP